MHLGFDRADRFTGAAANSYAAKNHMETPVPNDYVIVNESHKIRDLVLSPDVQITGITLLASSPDGQPVAVSLADFLAKIKTGSHDPVHDHVRQGPARHQDRRALLPVGGAFPKSAMISRISRAVSDGVLPTLTPAASRASFLACAVPDEPDTMAPAWPIVLPSGAVKPGDVADDRLGHVAP